MTPSNLLDVTAGVYANTGSRSDVDGIEADTQFHARTENLRLLVERALRTLRPENGV